MKGKYEHTHNTEILIKDLTARTRDGSVQWRLRFGVWTAKESPYNENLHWMIRGDENRLFNVIQGRLLIEPESHEQISELLKAIVLEGHHAPINFN